MEVSTVLNELVEKLRVKHHYLNDSDVEEIRKILDKHVNKEIDDLRSQVETLKYKYVSLSKPDSYYFDDSDEIVLLNDPLDLEYLDDYPHDKILEFTGIKHISKVYVTGVEITESDFEWQVFDSYEEAKKAQQ